MKVTSDPDPHRQCTSSSMLPALKPQLPRANWRGRPSSDAMQQQSYNFNFRQLGTRGRSSTCPSIISDATIDRLPEVEINADLDLPPSSQEIIRAVQQLSSGNAPVLDAIPAETYKHGGPQLMNQLKVLFQEMWHQGQVPQDLKDTNIVHLYKKKGKRQLCDNHRGISLLSIAGKILTHILLI
ncbi:unnamed protein product [Schistocephalus solidus]|uniref:Reverse transcriptase domain-containing protein n=1 Tax=Schistocephalus solidus TaxID=70667 RepID=A0A183TG89_SCHSO|nr:unnamed protein product [Schistocephalus solidus]